MSDPAESRSDAADRYLLLADISGYTTFLGGVAQAHGEDFSAGLPAGYRVLGELIQGLIDGLPQGFELIKVEGDAVLGAAPSVEVDGRGAPVLAQIGTAYRAFVELRDRLARTASDDKCAQCFAVASLDLKAVLHRGFVVQQPVGRQVDVIGPAVNVAHRLLKNTVRQRIGYRPYVIVTEAASLRLGVADVGLAHRETYADVGEVETRIIDLAELAGLPAAGPGLPVGAASWPEIRLPGS